jgi:hypothetical protein
MNARGLVASLAACLAIAGCSDDKFNGDKYSLTVFAYNAITGEPIASADLAKGLAIYQGAAKATPGVLDSGLEGAVVFNDLEADYTSGNKVFPIRAKISGYQDYQGEVSFAVADNTISTTKKVDDVYAQIGYIHLWPVGFHAPDYTFTVLYAGKPVPTATVQFALGDDPWASGNSQNHDVITQTYDGAIPALYGTTDANGKVTFAGTGLVLGETYYVKVLPVVVGGVTLGSQDSWVSVGTSLVDRVVNLASISNDPATSATHGLYVKSITPDPTVVQADGTLTFTFNIPVAKSSTFATDFSVTATGFTGGTAGVPSATATLSADGLTLTLKPNWTTAPTTVAQGATYAYSASLVSGALVVPAYPADAIFPSDLRLGATSENGGVSFASYLTVTAKGP